MTGQLNIKLLVASVHNLTVLLFSLIVFCLFPGSCNLLPLGSILKNVLPEKVSCTRGNFHSPSIQLPVS